MKTTTIGKTNQGELFRLQDKDTAAVYVRGEYNKALQKYSCHKYDDANAERFFAKDKKIFIGFTY